MAEPSAPHVGVLGAPGIVTGAVVALLRASGFAVTVARSNGDANRCDALVVLADGAGWDGLAWHALAGPAPPTVFVRELDGRPTPWNTVSWRADPAHLVSAVAAAAGSAPRPGLDGRPPAPPLSWRERECAVRYASGESARQVAAGLGLAETTVNTHLARVRDKYAVAGRDASTKTALLFRLLEDGVLPCPCHRAP